MKVLKLVDGIRTKFEIPRPVHKARDIICRLLYDMAFAKAMNAEEENKLPPPEFNDERTREMAQTYGIWIWQLSKVAQEHLHSAMTDVRVCFIIGHYILVPTHGVQMPVALKAYRQANPNASTQACVEYMLSHGLATRVYEPKGHAFKFYW